MSLNDERDIVLEALRQATEEFTKILLEMAEANPEAIRRGFAGFIQPPPTPQQLREERQEFGSLLDPDAFVERLFTRIANSSEQEAYDMLIPKRFTPNDTQTEGGSGGYGGY